MNINHGIQTLFTQPETDGFVYTRHRAVGNKAGHLCGGCAHYEPDSQERGMCMGVKRVRRDTEYCQWDTDKYKPKSTINERK